MAQNSKATTRDTPGFELTVLVRGVADETVVEYAKEKMFHALRATPRTILFGRLKITHEPHRSIARPAIVEMMLDVNGRALRVHVAAHELREAIDLAEQRLRRKLKDLEHGSEYLRTFTGIAEAGEWRRGDLASHRPDFFPRAPEEREIVRRKTFALGCMAPIHAAVEMETLDHDFHLFVDAETGSDAVIYRTPDGTYELMRATPAPAAETTQEFSISPEVPTEISLADAQARLNTSGERFVFFIDADSHRGNVLYRRYDGHYGLIAPAATG